MPFYEPELDSYFRRAKHEIGNIEFTTDVDGSIKQADVVFISVNTLALKLLVDQPVLGVPTDMRAFNSVVSQIGSLFQPGDSHKIIVEKSTVPLGTGQKVRELLQEKVGELYSCEDYFTVANMPEFLAEGTAINDLVRP